MTSDFSNYPREYSPDGSYSLFQFERSDVISVLKTSIEYNFVFCKCLRAGSFSSAVCGIWLTEWKKLICEISSFQQKTGNSN